MLGDLNANTHFRQKLSDYISILWLSIYGRVAVDGGCVGDTDGGTAVVSHPASSSGMIHSLVPLHSVPHRSGG